MTKRFVIRGQAHERNELALRQAQRDRSAAEDREALKTALERANEAGRAARHDAIAEIANNHHGRHHHGNHSSSERGGWERRYIYTDEEEEEEDDEEEDESGLSGGPNGEKNRAGANRSVDVFSPRSERQVDDEEEETHTRERSGLAPGGRRSGSSDGEQLGLQDVFCATRRGSPKVVAGRGERGREKPERRGEETRRGRHDGTRAEGADDSTSRSPSLEARKSGRSRPPTTAMANEEPKAKETRKNTKKPRDDTRHRHRNQSDEDEQEPPLSLPPPPRLADAHGGSSGEDRVDEGNHTAVEVTANQSKKKTRADLEPPRPPPQKVGSFPPTGRSRTRSVSSSNGSSGALSLFGEAVSSGTVLDTGREGARERESGAGALQRDRVSVETPTCLAAGGRRAAAARRTPSWSGEDENGRIKADAEEERIRTKVPATFFSLAADLDEGGRVDGSGSDKAQDSTSSSLSLPAAAPPDERSGTFLSLPATARAIAVLTAQIERLARTSALAAGRNLLVLEAYGSVTAERAAKHDAAAWGTEMTAAVAAAAAAKIPAADTHSSLPPELEAFGMVALCGAVLDLITAHATELLPPEALSGIVTVAKVRAQHRRGGKAGRVQLFDAVVGHARRLCSAAATTFEGESSRGEVDSAAIAAVFVPCFEAVLTAEVRRNGADNRASNARGAERLRRKVLALLESAADPNGASTKTRQIPSTEIAAMPAIVAAAATGCGGRGGDGAESEKPTKNATIASGDVGCKEQRQRQQDRWGSSTSAVGASSGGVVLGGGRSAGSRKKKGGRLDLSSFGGSMSIFDAAAHGGSLPEFEVRHWSRRGKGTGDVDSICTKKLTCHIHPSS